MRAPTPALRLIWKGLKFLMSDQQFPPSRKTSAKMVLESTEPPAVLRDAVISPAGTTARGVAALDEGAFRSTVVKAVVAAAQRSAELGKL